MLSELWDWEFFAVNLPWFRGIHFYFYESGQFYAEEAYLIAFCIVFFVFDFFSLPKKFYILGCLVCHCVYAIASGMLASYPREGL